ncbi:MAG: ABC transporter ATP-binding protein [Candidatus Rokubacteria bacterium]|nr:ABC transporter ATP-binding protein [Candidatus Rokubacteria bacterium]
MMELLRTAGLSRSFGSLQAVLDVDFAVGAGELRSIIGPNGAGKSTFFRLIAGELPPSSGRIRFKGRDITGLPQHAVSRLGIVKSYQITSVFPHLTVFENIRVAAQSRATAYNFWQKASALGAVRDRAERTLVAVGLAAKASHRAAHLSHGEKRNLEIGIALATEPELLLLDEPTAGMSPEETEATMRLISEIAGGRTVIVVEHNMKLVMKISQRITVLHQGQILAEGTPADIRANHRVQQVYLGGA